MEAKIAAGKLGVMFPSGIIHRETSECFTALFDAVMGAGVPVIVVSFANVKSLLSDGIRLLVVINDTARKAGRQFYITDLSREVKYTLQITNLLGAFAYVPVLGNILDKMQLTVNDLEPLEIVTVQAVPEPVAEAATAAPPEPAPAPAPAPTPAPAPAPRPAPAPASAPAPSHEAAPDHDAKRSNVTPPPPPMQLTEKDMKRIIKAHIPSRTAMAIVKVVLHLGHDVFSFDDIKRRVNENEGTLKTHFKRLLALGTVMPVGGGMYNFGVSRPIRREINALIAAFDSRASHSLVLKLILEAEHF